MPSFRIYFSYEIAGCEEWEADSEEEAIDKFMQQPYRPTGHIVPWSIKVTYTEREEKDE